MENINRLFWIIVFLSGVLIFGWLDWELGNSSQMVMFMLTSFWSAICAIGYTVLHWFLVKN